MLHRAATFAMGTRFELVLEGRDPGHAQAAADAALALVDECDARFSRFRSDSLVSRINREAGASWVRVDGVTFELLARCDAWRLQTRGAFDICVGRAMDCLRAADSGGSTNSLPPAGGYELDPACSSVRFMRPGSALDLGGIGKGVALDLAVEVLRDAGIDRALLHGGTSSVVALGAPPASPEGWRIGLGPEFEHATAALRDRALSVSAARGARLDDPSEASSEHILDPQDGSPVPRALRSAVCANSAREAEVWSTALLVLVARAQGLEHCLELAALPKDLEWLVHDPLAAPFQRASTATPSILIHESPSRAS